MKTIIENPAHRYSNRTVVGAIILVIGSLLLIGQFDFVPDWLFSWPLILIGAGVYSGYRHNFNNRSWIIMVLLGLAFLLQNSGLFISSSLWAIFLIAIGIYVIVKPGYNKNKPKLHQEN